MRLRGILWFATAAALIAACSSFSGEGVTPASDAGTDAEIAEAGPALTDAAIDHDVVTDSAGLRPTGANLTPSGDFEADAGGESCGDAWYSYQGGPLLREYGGHDSPFDCSFCRDTASVDVITFDESPLPNVTATAGAWFRASAWVRGGDGAPKTAIFTARVWNRGTDPNGTGHIEANKVTSPLEDSGSWQKLSMDFQIPADVEPGAQIDVYIELRDFPSSLPNCLDVDDFMVFALQ